MYLMEGYGLFIKLVAFLHSQGHCKDKIITSLLTSTTVCTFLMVAKTIIPLITVIQYHASGRVAYLKSVLNCEIIFSSFLSVHTAQPLWISLSLSGFLSVDTGNVRCTLLCGASGSDFYQKSVCCLFSKPVFFFLCWGSNIDHLWQIISCDRFTRCSAGNGWIAVILWIMLLCKPQLFNTAICWLAAEEH